MPPATPPPIPNQRVHRSLEGRSGTLSGRGLPAPEPPVAAGAHGERRESRRTDSGARGARPGPSPAAVSNRGQPGLFPYVESIPQYTPHSEAPRNGW